MHTIAWLKDHGGATRKNSASLKQRSRQLATETARIYQAAYGGASDLTASAGFDAPWGEGLGSFGVAYSDMTRTRYGPAMP